MKTFEVVLHNLETGEDVMRTVDGGSKEVALCKAMNMWIRGESKPIRLAQYMAGALNQKPPNQEFQLISIARIDDPFARPQKTRKPKISEGPEGDSERFMVHKEPPCDPSC